MKYYCIDCKEKIVQHESSRCHVCYFKFRIGVNHPLYKDGRTLQKYFCKDCERELKGTHAHEHERCTPCENKTRTGELSGNWKGGKTFEEYGPEFDSSLKEQVRFRDGYECRECGCSQLENRRCLDVHHIDYNKKNNILNNLIALCKSCHVKTNFNRNYWKNHFQERQLIYTPDFKAYEVE